MALSPAFRRLWLGQATSQLGDRIHQIATAWWVLELTGSPAMMGLLWVATSLPAVLLAPFAGALADRVERRALMLACDLARTGLTLIMAILALSHQLSVGGLFALAVLLAALGAAFTPASLAIVPQLVEEETLLRANALQELTTQGAAVLGPALGGVLVAALGAPWGFAVNGLSFAISALALARLGSAPRPTGSGGASYLESLREGFEVLRARPAIASLLAAFAIANVFLAPIPVLLPIFARERFHAGAWGLGLLEGALGGGMMLAALVLARRAEVRRKTVLIAGSFALQGLCLAGMGLSPSMGSFAGGLAILGASLSALNVVVLSAFQRAIPQEQLGRFMGLLTSIVLGIMPLSYGLAGMLATRVPPEGILAFSGLMLVAVGLSLPLMPGVSGLEREVGPAL